MSKTKPSLDAIYGAAFGFITDRTVKPVHFATGFLVSLLGRQYPNELLNQMVAASDGKQQSGSYALENLHPTLAKASKISPSVGPRQLHALRKHLRCLANNDEAVFPIFGKKASFGCDYSTASHDILTRISDNDGFSGYFVRSVLAESEDGQFVLEFVRECITKGGAPVREVFEPLLCDAADDEDMSDRYAAKFGEIQRKRLKRVAKVMRGRTAAVRSLCQNADALVASETKLRYVIIALCIWLFCYLIQEGQNSADGHFVLLSDFTGDPSSRMRAQSQWSYSRLREALAASFQAFNQAGRFADCADAWNYVETELNGRPKVEDFYRNLALRSGLAQPRASRVRAKHFEPQPDTLRILMLSVLPVGDSLVPLHDVLESLFSTWGLVFGGRPEDEEELERLGYSGLDQDRDLTPNSEALVHLLTELGLATQYSDGLVMCHSQPNYWK